MPTLNSPRRKEKVTKCTANKKPRWEQWVETNSKPKELNVKVAKPKPTRFQKPGPMSNEDWMRFHKWLSKQIPKKKKRHNNPYEGPHHCWEQPAAPPTPKLRKPKIVIPKPLTGMQRRNLQHRAQHVLNLSRPKHRREKYVPPPEEPHPWRPVLDPKKPPKPDKYRPFEPVKLPCWWYHEELEQAFWREMRFPLSCNALNYKITKHTKRLAERTEPKVHCEVPEKEEEPVAPRVKMDPQQWAMHLRRLDYLSDPKFKETRARRVKQKMLYQQRREAHSRSQRRI